MSLPLATEFGAVAKKVTPPVNTDRPLAEPPFERLEFQAPIGFTKRLDAARKKRGLSRSAYIRQAVLLLMDEDMGK